MLGRAGGGGVGVGVGVTTGAGCTATGSVAAGSTGAVCLRVSGGRDRAIISNNNMDPTAAPRTFISRGLMLVRGGHGVVVGLVRAGVITGRGAGFAVITEGITEVLATGGGTTGVGEDSSSACGFGVCCSKGWTAGAAKESVALDVKS